MERYTILWMRKHHVIKKIFNNLIFKLNANLVKTQQDGFLCEGGGKSWQSGSQMYMENHKI